MRCLLSEKDNMIGQDFEQYISAHDHIATAFSLSKSRWPNTETDSKSLHILNALDPFRLKTVQTNHWFHMYVPDENKLEIYIYVFNQETKAILLSNYHSIFYTGAVWDTPEDICFFKGRHLISGSVTHECICSVYEDELILPGQWKVLLDDTAEKIVIPY